MTSERINALSWPEEVFYRRLMSVVDDYGRYYAHPSLLRAALYPLQLGKVSDSDVGKWLLSSEKAGLVWVYPASDGKRYLELLDFRQHVRAKESRFPAPCACNADAVQMQSTCDASAHVFVFGDVVEDVIPQPSGCGGDRPVDDAPLPRPSLALVNARKTGLPDCPHREVLALWAEVLPHMPQHLPDHWHGKRADHLRARWRETAKAKGWRTAEDGLAYLRKLFGYVGDSAFLTGRKHAHNRDPFHAELAWLVEPQNWAKVHEGKYHTEQGVA